MKTTKVLMTALVMSSALMLTAHASAKHKGEPLSPEAAAERVDRIMERFDVNQDGVIDQSDRDAKKAEKFAKIDANNDGVITKEEMQAAKDAKRSERAANRAERSGERFAARDVDGDGALTLEEFSAKKEKGERHASRGERRGEGHGKGKKGKKGKFRKVLKKADANGDGAVTRAELEALMAKRAAR